jgi:hypothetical protein
MICTTGLPSASIWHSEKILKIALSSVLDLALSKDNFCNTSGVTVTKT